MGRVTRDMLFAGSSAVRPDGKRTAIIPSDVKGRFITRRRWVFAALLSFYLALPFLRIDGRPVVHLSIGERRFYLFGGTFNAQDTWLILFLAVGLIALLLFVTAWLGRAWCGWACPQTVFLEGLFRPIERLLEGRREERLRGANGPRPLRAWVRTGIKHALFVGIAFVLSHVALSLFVTVETLGGMIAHGPAAHPVEFAWAAAITLGLYLNFAIFREQLCIFVCPYGRLQSVLIDRQSAIVGYDEVRGEPRGRGGKTQRDGLGDCVDCNRCVTACPTGIDIRNGLQLECIACAQCIDACDDVMLKVGKPLGLIRFDSLAGLAGEERKVVRPRLLAYGALSLLAVSALAAVLVARKPFEANLLRAPGVSFVLDGDVVRNQFELHLVNKHPDRATFEVQISAPEGVEVILPQTHLELGSLEDLRVPLFLRAKRGVDVHGISLSVAAHGSSQSIPVSFLSPPRS